MALLEIVSQPEEHALRHLKLRDQRKLLGLLSQHVTRHGCSVSVPLVPQEQLQLTSSQILLRFVSLLPLALSCSILAATSPRAQTATIPCLSQPFNEVRYSSLTCRHPPGRQSAPGRHGAQPPWQRFCTSLWKVVSASHVALTSTSRAHAQRGTAAAMVSHAGRRSRPAGTSAQNAGSIAPHERNESARQKKERYEDNGLLRMSRMLVHSHNILITFLLAGRRRGHDSHFCPQHSKNHENPVTSCRCSLYRQ
jgi:hypothetical protein